MSQHHAASAGFGKANLSYLFHSLVCLAVMFGVRLLPPSPPLTAQGMALISIFLGVLYGWIFIEIIWPSIAGMLALALTAVFPRSRCSPRASAAPPWS